MEFHGALCWDQCFFILYTIPLSTIIHSFDINHHLYADDTQIVMSLSVSNVKESLEKLQHCVITVSTWMTGSKLKLNPSKTDFFLTGTKLQREKILNIFPCPILGRDTSSSASAKNLGVVFNNSPDFLKDISQKKTYTVYPKHVGHASIVSVICVHFENDSPWIYPSKLQWHWSVAS